MEEQGTKNISDRAQMMWGVRYALLHAYRSEFDLALKYARSVMPFIPTMTNVWFLGVYFFSLTYVVRIPFFFWLSYAPDPSSQLLKLWKHFCNLQAGKLLDISEPLTAEMRKESHGTILADLQNYIDQMRAYLAAECDW